MNITKAQVVEHHNASWWTGTVTEDTVHIQKAQPSVFWNDPRVFVQYRVTFPGNIRADYSAYLTPENQEQSA